MAVTPEIVREYLGVPKFRTEKEVEERVKKPGVAVGLVWTPVGGDIIFIEATRMRGGKQFTMTGHLGEVMQESMTAALTWVRANAERYGIDPDFFRKHDIHIHVPSGAVPKDGPSAGAAMVTRFGQFAHRAASTRSPGDDRRNDAVRHRAADWWREGESAWAKRAGIKEVLLPADNEPNAVADLTPDILGDIKITYVRNSGRGSGARAVQGSGRASSDCSGAATQDRRTRRAAGDSLTSRFETVRPSLH